MKKQNLINNMITILVVFIFSIQSVNANENRINKLNQKFSSFFSCLKKNTDNEIEKTKDFQIREWKEASKKYKKKAKVVQHKLTGFF